MEIPRGVCGTLQVCFRFQSIRRPTIANLLSAPLREDEANAATNESCGIIYIVSTYIPQSLTVLLQS